MKRGVLLMKKTVVVAGLGLMGGSMAMAFKQNTDWTVYGWNRTRAVAEKALAQGAIDGIADEETIAGCDLLIPVLYPEATIDFLRRMIPLFVLCCPNQIYAAALRGAGDSKTPMYMMLFSFVVFRQVYLFVMSNYISNTILPLAMGYPVGWAVCSLLLVVYYHKAHLNGTKLNLEEQL